MGIFMIVSVVILIWYKKENYSFFLHCWELGKTHSFPACWCPITGLHCYPCCLCLHILRLIHNQLLWVHIRMLSADWLFLHHLLHLQLLWLRCKHPLCHYLGVLHSHTLNFLVDHPTSLQKQDPLLLHILFTGTAGPVSLEMLNKAATDLEMKGMINFKGCTKYLANKATK